MMRKTITILLFVSSITFLKWHFHQNLGEEYQSSDSDTSRADLFKSAIIIENKRFLNMCVYVIPHTAIKKVTFWSLKSH